MIDIGYRGQGMDVEMNRWQKLGAIRSMSPNALASDDPRSFEKKSRKNYEGTACIFRDMTCDP
jgi:hypothetical protein